MPQMRNQTVKNQGGSQEMTNVLDERLTVDKPNKKFPNVTVTQMGLNRGGGQKFTDLDFFLLYKKGHPDSKIARILGVSRTPVRERRLKFGLPPQPRRKRE